MKRRRALRTDPEKAQAWRERSQERQRAKQTRRAPLRVDPTKQQNWGRGNPPPRRSRVPGLRGFTQRVFVLYGRRCIVCRGRASQAHHVVPLRVLFATGEDIALELGGDARNGTPICADCHERHENASRRIRRDQLPQGVIDWAEENGFGWYIDRPGIYPRGGHR